MSLESPVRPFPTLRQIWQDFGGVYAANGFIGFVFAASGPVAIVLTVGAKGGLSEAELASWIFGSFFLNGLISIAFCWLYRGPLVFFWTIPGTVLIGPALDHLSFAEVIGAFYATAALMLVLGLTGRVRRTMESVPMPIVMAMVAGVFLQFGIDLVLAFGDGFWIAAPMTLVFLAASAWPALGQRLPPLIGALIAGIAMVAVLGGLDIEPGTAFAMNPPTLFAPAFSWQAMVELVVPLAITVLVVQNGQGYAVLKAAGHAAPMNAITVACGIGAAASAAVGAVSTCLTGPTNAIISSGGERERHYTAGIFVGLLALVFGLFAPVFVRFLLATPSAFIATIAGLAMLRVLQAAFGTAFGGGKFPVGALVTFLVTVADISIFNIGAPFWGLAIGFAVAGLLERQDFAKN